MDRAGQGHPHFDATDRVYLGLRVAALAAGLAYVLSTAGPDGARTDLLVAFGAFAAYSLTIYVGGWTLFKSHLKGRFYWTTGAIDFLFIVLLIHMTGGGAGPMVRALYLWVAIAAFYSGQRGGSLASGAAFVAFVWFFALDEAAQDPFGLSMKAGGLLLHGPVIGFLVDRDRRRERVLRAAREEVAFTDEALGTPD